jgi:hypothetical protein
MLPSDTPDYSHTISPEERGKLLDIYLEAAERLETGLHALNVDARDDLARAIKKIKVARFDAKFHGRGCTANTCKADEI